jgi:hypothetical protein
MNEVIKRDVLEGDKADEARKKVAKSANKMLRPPPVKPTPADVAAAEAL